MLRFLVELRPGGRAFSAQSPPSCSAKSVRSTGNWASACGLRAANEQLFKRQRFSRNLLDVGRFVRDLGRQQWRIKPATAQGPRILLKILDGADLCFSVRPFSRATIALLFDLALKLISSATCEAILIHLRRADCLIFFQIFAEPNQLSRFVCAGWQRSSFLPRPFQICIGRQLKTSCSLEQQ